MVLSEKETAAIKDLQTQEKTCVEKYSRYSKEAKDPVLVNLFTDLHKKEQQHFDSLGPVPCRTATATTAMERIITRPPPTPSRSPRTRKTTASLRPTASVPRSWCLPSIIPTCLCLQTRASANCSQTFRWRSRIMRRCSISIRLSTACHKADKVSCIREVPVQRVPHAGLFLTYRIGVSKGL
jgi:hypothetical protein